MSFIRGNVYKALIINYVLLIFLFLLLGKTWNLKLKTKANCLIRTLLNAIENKFGIKPIIGDYRPG